MELIYDAAERVRYHYVLVDYLCTALPDKPLGASDVDEARWFEIEQLEGLEMTEGAVEVIAKALKIDRREAEGR